MSDVDDLFGSFFKTPRRDAPKPKPATTTDTPNVKLFMLQMINAYARLTDNEGMRWERSFSNRQNGKEYTVTITLTEKP